MLSAVHFLSSRCFVLSLQLHVSGRLVVLDKILLLGVLMNASMLFMQQKLCLIVLLLQIGRSSLLAGSSPTEVFYCCYSTRMFISTFVEWCVTCVMIEKSCTKLYKICGVGYMFCIYIYTICCWSYLSLQYSCYLYLERRFGGNTQQCL